MGKIDAEQIADVDMEDLTRRLQAG
jgi:hypothetical protein